MSASDRQKWCKHGNQASTMPQPEYEAFSACFLGMPAKLGAQFLLAISPAKIGVWGAICWNLCPRPPDLHERAPGEVPSHCCRSGKLGDSFLRTPFWHAFCLLSGPTPWAPLAQTAHPELLRRVQKKVLHAWNWLVAVGHLLRPTWPT
eukprot:1138350-Pelagomonas_calceolata.AAC.4